MALTLFEVKIGKLVTYASREEAVDNIKKHRAFYDEFHAKFGGKLLGAFEVVSGGDGCELAFILGWPSPETRHLAMMEMMQDEGMKERYADFVRHIDTSVHWVGEAYDEAHTPGQMDEGGLPVMLTTMRMKAHPFQCAERLVAHNEKVQKDMGVDMPVKGIIIPHVAYTNYSLVALLPLSPEKITEALSKGGEYFRDKSKWGEANDLFQILEPGQQRVLMPIT